MKKFISILLLLVLFCMPIMVGAVDDPTNNNTTNLPGNNDNNINNNDNVPGVGDDNTNNNPNNDINGYDNNNNYGANNNDDMDNDNDGINDDIDADDNQNDFVMWVVIGVGAFALGALIFYFASDKRGTTINK